MAQRVLAETKDGHLFQSVIESTKFDIRKRFHARDCRIHEMKRVILFWYDIRDKYTGEVKRCGTVYGADAAEAMEHAKGLLAEYEKQFSFVELQLEDEAE